MGLACDDDSKTRKQATPTPTPAPAPAPTATLTPTPSPHRIPNTATLALTLTQPDATPSPGPQQACGSCKVARVKCDLDAISGVPCSRCRKFGLPCVPHAPARRGGSCATPLPDPAQGIVWSAGRMAPGQQGELHGPLVAPPPRASSADAPVARRAAAPAAYAHAGVGGRRATVHPQAEQPPRQPLPAKHPGPPTPPPAAMVGDVVGDAPLHGVTRAGLGETTPRNPDAPQALQKRRRPPDPASSSLATVNAPAATRCRSG